MEDIKEFDIKDFACILLLLALFPTEETEELFDKYALKYNESCYNNQKE